MRTLEYDIVVLGGGCIGSSILAELSRVGFSNLALVDEGQKTVSATAQSGGMLRVFHEHLDHVELALAHYQHQRDYLHAGTLTETPSLEGHLYFFNPARYPQYQDNLRRMDEAGYPFEVLAASQGRERFPEFHWSNNEWAIYEPAGTSLSPLRFATDLQAAAQRVGAHVHPCFGVRRLSFHRDRYHLWGENGSISARALILAGGARMIPLMEGFGLRLPLESRALTVHRAQSAATNFRAPHFFDRETLQYARLGRGVEPLFGQRSFERMTHPTWTLIEERTALDCYAPNRLGFAAQVPGHPRLILATGWGGTAFKFSLEVGRRVAHLVERDLPERRSHHVFF